MEPMRTWTCYGRSTSGSLLCGKRSKMPRSSHYVNRWCNPKDDLRRRAFVSIHCRHLNINNGSLQQENDFTLVSMLKTCAKRRDLSKGTTLHAHILKKGLLGKSPYLASTIINMYAKCGVLEKAKQVLDELPFRDVVSWNALIAGYTQQGQGHEALSCFERMQTDGFSPNAVTFTCILKACGSTGAIDKGKEIHEEIVSKGMLERDIVLGTALVDMYAKCGGLEKAQEVLEELPMRNVVSWTALIAGYAQQGQDHAALNCFERMQSEGLLPNAITFICILKACGGTKSIRKGEQIHDAIMHQGLLYNDIALANALVDMYAKCAMLAKAQQVLEELPYRNVVSWNALITGYMEQGYDHETLNCFERMQSEGLVPNGLTYIHVLKACSRTGSIDKGQKIHEKIVNLGLLEKDVVLGTALVDMYAKCGMLGKAQKVLEKLSSRDVVAWNALITGYAEGGEHCKALYCFDQMQSEGLSPDEVTYVCILNACGSTRAIDKGKQIHENIVRNGLLRKCIMLGNALVDMYAKCGLLGKAREVLSRLPHRNIVSWSALIAGYAQQGQGHEALDCFEKMQREGISPNTVTLICILKACGSTGAIDKGKEIHEDATHRGLLNDIGLGNALIDMYTKCDMLSKAQEVLEELPFRNIVSWNTLVAGYAQHGQFHQAVSCFEQMQCEGLLPNRVTFLCLLSACSHSGMLDDAQMLFGSMIEKSGITPDVEHHTCMVVAFGCAGCFDDAIAVIKVVPSSDYTIWLALLGACKKWGNVKLGRLVFDQIVQLECSSAAAYILMANIFSAAGMQRDLEKIEAMRLKYAPAMPHMSKREFMIRDPNCLHISEDDCGATNFECPI